MGWRYLILTRIINIMSRRRKKPGDKKYLMLLILAKYTKGKRNVWDERKMGKNKYLRKEFYPVTKTWWMDRRTLNSSYGNEYIDIKDKQFSSNNTCDWTHAHIHTRINLIQNPFFVQKKREEIENKRRREKSDGSDISQWKHDVVIFYKQKQKKNEENRKATVQSINKDAHILYRVNVIHSNQLFEEAKQHSEHQAFLSKSTMERRKKRDAENTRIKEISL